jgi:UDP-N-acetylmuramate: L-alanyl-gamma-D-glutamyl-meso-diaminopimelate ligase
LPPEIARPPGPPQGEVRHVHFIAVCGTGMGTLACTLAARGLRVTGSDVAAYPPMSDQLAAAGIQVQMGWKPEHVVAPRPDLVVIGNAVRRDNPEARAAIDGGLPYLSFPDSVAHFCLRERHSVVVAGTHGKTTSTSLIGWILTHAGLDPGLLVGGVARNFNGSFRLGDGPHFVIEGDEYDTAFFDKTPKFLHYQARTVLFTSCEFDHADIYASLEQIQAAFRKLVESVPADGRIVAATDAETVRAVLERVAAPVEGYGFREGAKWRATDISFDARGTVFTAWRGRDRLVRVSVPLHGRHNVENCLGALAVCVGLGVAPEAVAAALAEFKGVKRRQEVRGSAGGVTVIDDFAHHPTAVRETIAAVRAAYPGARVVAIFEPRTNTSRRRFFERDYVDALASADEVILAGVYRSEDLPEAERLRPEEVIRGRQRTGRAACYLPEVDEIIEHVVAHRTGNDVALVMSNGGFGGIWDRLLDRLKS